MKHATALPVVLSLLLSLGSAPGALGQTVTSMVPLMDWPERIGNGPFAFVGQWLAPRKAECEHRRTHPSFRIRLGRGLSITIPKH